MTLEIIALSVAVVALGVVTWLSLQVSSLKRRLAAVPEDGDVLRVLRDLDTDLANTEELVADLAPRVAAVEGRLPLSLSHVGMISYDAFGDIAGNLSRSVAVVDSRGNGFVISLLVGRNDSRFFTKQVRGRQGVEELSPEESAAVDQALSN